MKGMVPKILGHMSITYKRELSIKVNIIKLKGHS